jgi:hypothetical protein
VAQTLLQYPQQAFTNMTFIPYCPSRRTTPSVIFSIPEDDIKAQGASFCQHYRDPKRIAERDDETDEKRLTEFHLFMEFCSNRCISAKVFYFEGDGVNRNFGRFKSYGREISGTFV